MPLGASTIDSTVVRDAEGNPVSASKTGAKVRLDVRDDSGDEVQAQILTTLVQIRDILMEMNA